VTPLIIHKLLGITAHQAPDDIYFKHTNHVASKSTAGRQILSSAPILACRVLARE
jgi:hypothetical protein